MPTMLNKLLHRLSSRPRILFLVDGLGALLSALLLVGPVTLFESAFGIPQRLAFVLAIVAFVFTLHALGCYAFRVRHWDVSFRIIAFGNLVYSVVIQGILISLGSRLTTLGIAYLLGETIIILFITALELAALSKAGKS